MNATYIFKLYHELFILSNNSIAKQFFRLFLIFRMPDEIKRLSERYPDIIQVCYLNKSNNNLESGENDDED